MTVLLRTPSAGLRAKVRASQVWFVWELLWASHIKISWTLRTGNHYRPILQMKKLRPRRGSDLARVAELVCCRAGVGTWRLASRMCARGPPPSPRWPPSLPLPAFHPESGGALGRPPSPSADGCCTRAHAPNDGHLADRSQVFARARRRRGPRAQWRARLARTPLPSPTPRAPPQVGRQQKRVAGAGSGGCRALDPLSQACPGCRPRTVGPEPPDPGKALEAGPSAASAPGPLSECSLHQAPEALDPSPREAHRLLVQILFPFPSPSPSASPPPTSLCALPVIVLPLPSPRIFSISIPGTVMQATSYSPSPTPNSQ